MSLRIKVLSDDSLAKFFPNEVGCGIKDLSLVIGPSRIGCVTLGKLLNLSEIQFSYLYSGVDPIIALLLC